MANLERPATMRLTLKHFPTEERDWLEEEGLRRKRAGLPYTATAIVVEALRQHRAHGGHTPDEAAQRGEQ